LDKAREAQEQETCAIGALFGNRVQMTGGSRRQTYPDSPCLVAADLVDVARLEDRVHGEALDDFGDAFDGRLEYQRPRFIIFYNTKYDAWPHMGEHHPKVKFTVAHELGHFFLNAHRIQRLVEFIAEIAVRTD